MTRRLVALSAALALAAGGVTWWVAREPSDSAAAAADQARAAVPDLPDPTVDAAAPTWDRAVSHPREDSYYPRVGDPGVDALHYDLDLTWLPADHVLKGSETLVFRSTRNADSFRLDLIGQLAVSAVEVDGQAVTFSHPGKDVVVDHTVKAGQRYVVVLAYSGTPEPVPAPTTRSDFSTTGWTITNSDEVWTMQEPFGAYTWYAVNDQPADKAFYDFTIRVASPWVGIANGKLVSRTEDGPDTVTRFHLDSPASSYLTTIAIGDYRMVTRATAGGTPVTLWAPRGVTGAVKDLSYVVPAIEWIEKKLGPYPFSTAGAVLTGSQSAMETQTMLTLGNNSYVRSKPVIVHELVHQWYGDLVTPTDWRDVWMNEGMTMYLQIVYEAETGGTPLGRAMRELRDYDQQLRDQAGPPGDYDPAMFGESNIYYCPALMWHELRERIGDKRFWALVRAWPRAHRFHNATRKQWFDFLERRTGLELTRFFHRWIDGERTPGG